MNDMTLVRVISRDRLILLELDGCLLIPLFIVLDPEGQVSDQEVPTRERVHLQGGNLNVDASLRQLRQACCKLSLERCAKDGVSFF